MSSFRAYASENARTKVCVDHRTIMPKRPWARDEVNRSKRTIKDEPVNRLHHGETISIDTTLPPSLQPAALIDVLIQVGIEFMVL